MTFRVRTALVVLVLTTLTMGVAFTVVWERFVASQRHRLDDALLVVAHREAAETARGIMEFTDAPGPSADAVGPLPKYGVVYTADGQTLATTSNFSSVPPMPRNVGLDEGFDMEHDGLRMRAVVVRMPGSSHRILLATSREDFEEDAAILAGAMATAFGVGCLWAALVAYGVATILTRNHRAVAEVARQVARGDTSARVRFQSLDVDLQQLADDLNVMIERLVGLVAVQDRFIAHAAHELRTPLTSLRVELEHTLETARGPDDYDSGLRGALASSERLTDLTEDLLRLARLRAKPSADGLSEFEASLADAIADVTPIGRHRRISIVAAPVSARARGDQRSVARILRNVLDNAVRFSPPDGSVRVDATLQDEHIVVTVLDEGPGVPEADAEGIFEPFTSGLRRDGTEGTGLGLPIARELARSYGGEVSVVPGPRGRFVIRLPTSVAAPRS